MTLWNESTSSAAWNGLTSHCSGPELAILALRPLRPRALDRQVNIGVLASHEGTTLQEVIDACATGALRAQVVVVIGNNRDSHALERARAAGVAAHHLSGQTHTDHEALDTAICGTLVDAGVDIVVLAGYMKRLGPLTLSRFRRRVLNTHPALLPKFGGQGMHGLNVHRAVLAAGETMTGASIHIVTADYDAGPVIAQCEVPVRPGDTAETFAQRVQERERTLLVDVLTRIVDGTIAIPPDDRDAGGPTDWFSGPAASDAERSRES